jgi:four helix bundle protein
MTKEDLIKRFKIWAVEVVLFTRKFPNEPDLKAIRNQMIRCVPSVAANYRAACRGKSTADFINKLKNVEEELDESMFWLEFIVALEPSLREDFVSKFKEANELLSIVVATIKTSRKNQEISTQNRKSLNQKS